MAGVISDAAQMAISVVLAGLVSGCGIAAKVNARNDMEASKAAYKACLAQHPEDVPACEGPREAYEADLAAYRATSAALRPGAAFTVGQSTNFVPPSAPPPPTNMLSVTFGPNGQAHPCLPMGPMMTVCN